MSGEFSQLASRLELGEVSSWIVVNAKNLPSVSQVNVPRMVLHYPLPAIPLKTGEIQSIADDPPMAILQNANEIIFVTLYANPARF